MSLNVKLFCVFVICCGMEIFQVQSAAVHPTMHLLRSKRQLVLYDTNASNKNGIVNADASFGKWSDPKMENNGKLFYASSGAKANNDGVGVNGQVGFIRHKVITPYNFGVEHDVLTAGVDAEFGRNRFGGIARAAAVDGTLHLGPANLNNGVAVDTGVMFDKRNVEAKLLGTGFKAGADGFQLCVVICGGINWG